MPVITIERPIFLGRNNAKSVVVSEVMPEAASPRPQGRVPRVAHLLALAHRFDEALRSGEVADQSELAELGRVTTARVSQIMSLLSLAPDIQDAVLHLPTTRRGRDPIVLHQLIKIAMHLDWQRQRQLWAQLQLPARSRAEIAGAS